VTSSLGAAFSIAFTNTLKQNVDLPKRTAEQQPQSCAAWLIFLCCLMILSSHPCGAQEPLESVDNQTLSINFINLKPENTIGPSHLQLYADGTLDFSIENEILIITRGSWSLDKNRFTASINFTIDKQTPFHYLLKLDGYCLMGLYTGLARLHELNRNKELTQEIRFLFYALPPDYRGSGTFPKMPNN